MDTWEPTLNKKHIIVLFTALSLLLSLLIGVDVVVRTADTDTGPELLAPVKDSDTDAGK